MFQTYNDQMPKRNLWRMPQVRKEAGLFRLAPMPLYFITCWTMFCGDCAQVTALLLIIIKLFRRRWAATNISRPRSRWLLPSRDKKPQWTAHANFSSEFTEFFDSLTSWAKDAVLSTLCSVQALSPLWLPCHATSASMMLNIWKRWCSSPKTGVQSVNPK